MKSNSSLYSMGTRYKWIGEMRDTYRFRFSVEKWVIFIPRKVEGKDRRRGRAESG